MIDADSKIVRVTLKPKRHPMLIQVLCQRLTSKELVPSLVSLPCPVKPIVIVKQVGVSVMVDEMIMTRTACHSRFFRQLLTCEDWCPVPFINKRLVSRVSSNQAIRLQIPSVKRR